ncbi:sorting nexin-24 isoform X4 [Equus asinus]|uniref:sorting nexin-24 isoform X4 n=1 Tax=Equus quagga TaxID=89248 RepID=UPI001EE287D0|nr:sorting nexin-24 isoform X4 [Equus quagga]
MWLMERFPNLSPRTGVKEPCMFWFSSSPRYATLSTNYIKSYVFKIEVLMNGRKHFVEKRYSEFHALHKKAVILENEELPKLFLDFLNVRHLPSLPKAESCGSFDETESEESSKLSHQPVLLFLRDPYVLPAASDFPNVVIEGVLHGIFYPHLQPR